MTYNLSELNKNKIKNTYNKEPLITKYGEIIFKKIYSIGKNN